MTSEAIMPQMNLGPLSRQGKSPAMGPNPREARLEADIDATI